jgi:hypothetical protein
VRGLRRAVQKISLRGVRGQSETKIARGIYAAVAGETGRRRPTQGEQTMKTTQAEIRRQQRDANNYAAQMMDRRFRGPCERCRMRKAECAARVVADGPLVVMCGECYWSLPNSQLTPIDPDHDAALVRAGVFMELP